MNRRGIALLLALLGIVLAAVLATATLTAARLRWRTGRGLLAAAQASTAVSASLAVRQAAWDPRSVDTVPIGQAVPWAASVPSTPSVLTYDSIIRLGPALYQLRTVAERVTADGTLLARDGAVELIELAAPLLVDSSAVVAPVAPIVGGTAVIDGADRVPPGWDTLCPTPEPSDLAFVADPDPFTRLTPISLDELASWAEIRPAGSVAPPAPVVDSAGVCLTALTNWGDPHGGACRDRQPLVVLQPGATVADGKGQGILIAQGTLSLSGDFYFAGVILALGDVRLDGRAIVLGTILAVGGVHLADQASVGRSTCAVRRALTAQRRIAGQVGGGWWRVP